jgi:SAM-dependent methyltransferase
LIHPFDLKHGTDTGGYLRPADLLTGHKHDSMNNGYSAVAPSVFREACRRWRETLSTSADHLEAYTFVDIGAGKGRALLLASEFPFRKVLGVELNEELAQIAQRNITQCSRVLRTLSRIRILHQDASRIQWPRAPLLVYLNNPFDCGMVEQMAGSLADARASDSGPIDILYVNPGCADAFTKHGRFKTLWDAQIQMDEADRRADPYGAASDRVTAFRCCVTKARRP